MASASTPTGSPPVPECDSWVISTPKLPSLTFSWEIDKYLKVLKYNGGRIVMSPQFVGKPGVNSKWHIQVRVNRASEALGFAENLSVYLCLTEIDQQDDRMPDVIPGYIHIYLYNPTNGATHEAGSSVGRTIHSVKFRKGLGWGFDTFIPMATLRDPNFKAVSAGRLVIKCDVWLGKERLSHRQGAGLHNHNRHLAARVTSADKLSSDLGQLFRDAVASDVTIRTVNQRFPAHKVVLAARSSVFRGMLCKDSSPTTTATMMTTTSTQKSVKIKINDFDGDVVGLMLGFLYTADVDRDRASLKATDLFRIAHKYDIPDLWSLAEDIIVQQITVENAMDILVLGHDYQSTLILQHVVNVINMKKSEVVVTPAYRRVLTTCPAAFVHLFSPNF